MAVRLITSLILIFIAFAAFPTEAKEEKPPLAVSIVADPLLRGRFNTQEEFDAHILDIINRASLIFNMNVGRRLVLDALEVGLPPNTGFIINDINAFEYLSEKLNKHPSRFWVFLIYRPLASCNIQGILAGCAVMNESRSIVVYNSDIRFAVQNLLHELGHNCGANHSESKNFIMYVNDRNAVSYGDKTSIIRDNCG